MQVDVKHLSRRERSARAFSCEPGEGLATSPSSERPSPAVSLTLAVDLSLRER
jgi:hypothetical protein